MRRNSPRSGNGHDGRPAAASALTQLDSRVPTATEPVAPALCDSVFIKPGISEGSREGGLGTTYFPARRFPGMPERFRESGSITAALESYGLGGYERKFTRVTARPADAFEQKHLRLSRHQPVLVAEAVDCDDTGKPISYGIARFAAERIQFVIEP